MLQMHVISFEKLVSTYNGALQPSYDCVTSSPSNLPHNLLSIGGQTYVEMHCVGGYGSSAVRLLDKKGISTSNNDL